MLLLWEQCQRQSWVGRRKCTVDLGNYSVSAPTCMQQWILPRRISSGAECGDYTILAGLSALKYRYLLFSWGMLCNSECIMCVRFCSVEVAQWKTPTQTNVSLGDYPLKLIKMGKKRGNLMNERKWAGGSLLFEGWKGRESWNLYLAYYC